MTFKVHIIDTSDGIDTSFRCETEKEAYERGLDEIEVTLGDGAYFRIVDEDTNREIGIYDRYGDCVF